MRWLVGDLQGCVEPFERLLEEIRFDEHRDELWVLGDLVNRGPESAATVRLWRDIGGKAILGNHDVNVLLTAAGLRERRRDTMDDFYAANDRDELLALLRELPVLVHLPAPVDRALDVWIVHAGLRPDWTDLPALVPAVNEAEHDDTWLRSAAVTFATRVRCCTAKGEVSRETGPPEECRKPFRPWDAFYRGETLIVHGHWAQRGHYRGERTMGLDSGCVYGGPLTAWCQDDDRVVQVPGQTER
jgi:bis(5'-nucleosyl)-tetraphosphatase (symmetrical)